MISWREAKPGGRWPGRGSWPLAPLAVALVAAVGAGCRDLGIEARDLGADSHADTDASAGDAGPEAAGCPPDASATPQPEGRTPGGAACHESGPGPHPAIRTVFDPNVRVPSAPRAAYETSPAIAVDPRVDSRRVAVAFLAFDDACEPSAVVAISDDDGTTFRSDFVTVLRVASHWVLPPAIAHDHNGRLYLAIAGGGGVENPWSIDVRSTDDGTTFTPPKRVIAGVGKLGAVELTAGFSTLALTVARGSTIDVLRSFDGGASWDPAPTPVGDAGGRDRVSRPSARFDPSDYLGVLWLRGSSGAAAPAEVVFATLPPTDPPTAAVRVSKPGEPVVDQPIALGMGLGTSLFAAWSASSGAESEGHWDIHSADSPDGGMTWSDVVVVNEDDTCATHFLVAGEADARGALQMAWIDNQRGQGMAVAGANSRIGVLPPNRALSDAFFPFVSTRPGPDSPGGRLAVALKGEVLWAAWADARPIADLPPGRAHVWVTHGTVGFGL